MSEWKEGIWICVSVFLAAVFVMLFSTVGAAVREATKIEQDNVNNVEVLRGYYKTGSYDDVIVRQADVVNCIIGFRGKYDVYATSYITSDNYSSVTYDCVWNSSTADAWFQFDNISTLLPPSAQYRALTIKDANGAIMGFRFKRIN